MCRKLSFGDFKNRFLNIEVDPSLESRTDSMAIMIKEELDNICKKEYNEYLQKLNM